jgi:hypothetical protein
VHRTSLGGKKVFTFTVKPDVGYLQVATQSVANAEGFTPNDAQAAVASLEALNSSTMTIYVSKSGHRIVGAEVKTPTDDIALSYGHFDSSAVTAEPQTKLVWQSFAPYQYQLEAQAAANLTSAAKDKLRQDNLQQLHTYLASYFNQNGYYPTAASLNDANWVVANLNLPDIELLRDPLAPGLQLSSEPKANLFAYQVQPASGKGACDNTPARLCAHYKLTATLSDGKPYSVQDP